jgi:hypothetical protein
MYSSTDRVRARWPPRCTAALEAFFQLERQAEALDYDGQRRMFTHSSRVGLMPFSRRVQERRGEFLQPPVTESSERWRVVSPANLTGA